MILREIPPVHRLLESSQLKDHINIWGREKVKSKINHFLKDLRQQIIADEIKFPSSFEILELLEAELKSLSTSSFANIINGTGIILHTNIGRAPLSEEVLKNLQKKASGYSNLELNLLTGKRGQRQNHLKKILHELTGAEDALVVNNNAAAVFLILHTFAKNKEVILSRGEMVEIGESFRLPEIMEDAGAILKEVGATNCTRIKDYQKNICDNTAIILKSHPSNYQILGYTKETKIEEIIAFLKESPFHPLTVYDLGSGLLSRNFFKDHLFNDEPTVQELVKKDIDLITFSGDKLLGGPQAGIILGKSKYIQALKKNPLMRILRPGKLSLIALEETLKLFLMPSELTKKHSLFKFLVQTQEDLYEKANFIQDTLFQHQLRCQIVESEGHIGGGTTPNKKIKSLAIKLPVNREKDYSKETFLQLLSPPNSLLALLKEGNIYLDLFAIDKNELPFVVEKILSVYQKKTFTLDN